MGIWMRYAVVVLSKEKSLKRERGKQRKRVKEKERKKYKLDFNFSEP
jgi:hypothetical protein